MSELFTILPNPRSLFFYVSCANPNILAESVPNFCILFREEFVFSFCLNENQVTT